VVLSISSLWALPPGQELRWEKEGYENGNVRVSQLEEGGRSLVVVVVVCIRVRIGQGISVGTVHDLRKIIPMDSKVQLFTGFAVSSHWYPLVQSWFSGEKRKDAVDWLPMKKEVMDSRRRG
jgi:hypothetical protein